MDLAVLAQESPYLPGLAPMVLFFMDGETTAAHPGGTGYFYANFAGTVDPFLGLSNVSATNSILEVTALKSYLPTVPGNPVVPTHHDVIIESYVGAAGFNVIDDLTLGHFVATYGYGKIDTNRMLMTKNAQNESFVGFTSLGIAVTQDPAAGYHDIADIVVLSDSPVGFAEIFRGDLTTGGGYGLQTGNNIDNAGIEFDYNDGSANPVAIVAVPNPAGTAFSNVAILDYDTSPARYHLPVEHHRGDGRPAHRGEI